MIAKRLLSSVALSVIAAVLPMGAQANDVYEERAQPFSGDINPFSGDINPFSGDINPFSGDINPFGGDISPFGGDISPFAGDINPFRGDISPFYGDISPFWGDISPFWGDISPFSGDISPFSGDVIPFGGDIYAFSGTSQPVWGESSPYGGDSTAFSGDIVAFSGDIVSFDGDATNVGTYWDAAGKLWGDLNGNWSNNLTQTQTNLDAFIAFTEQVWDTAVQNEFGRNVKDEIDALLANYGVDRNSANSLANFDAMERSQFFLELYDTLSLASGTDIVDHWMPTINWTPVITQDQSQGNDSIVGLLDVKISTTDDNIAYLVDKGGYNDSINEHGAAVASLIGARHDGQGVMGIAPQSVVFAYNPFDATGTASKQDVKAGVKKLAAEGANVINMSLGFPDYVFNQEMANIFSDGYLQQRRRDTVFVIAAGNEGVTQTSNVSVNKNDQFDNLLIVGSVDPTKTISYFSNRPGEACIERKNSCAEEDKLKYRFLVAPGELLLTSDNAGGVTRMSGTSFAAPLVTGAVSLLHDRWPWLQNHSEETADIILQSAEDLGAPGVDGTYGWGLLDVEASQSPLDFDNLTFYVYGNSGSATALSSSAFQSTLLVPGQLDLWEATGASVTVFENIGSTYRDFDIPLSTMLWGQTALVNGGTERYQRYIYDRLVDWAGGPTTFASVDALEAGVVNFGSWNLSMLASPMDPTAPIRQLERPFASTLKLTSDNGAMTFSVGDGLGALALTQTDGFDRYADFDPETGGVNPFLGFATGGFYSGVATRIAPGVTLGFGFTQAEDDHSYVDQFTGEYLTDLPSLADYRASAVNVDVAYDLSSRLALNVAYTRLNEATGVLGAQGVGVLALDDGATTDAVTLGASYALSPRLDLSFSATTGRTFDGELGTQSLGVASEGIVTTAFQFAAARGDLLKADDTLRLIVAQPLHVENGALEFQSVQVVNRVTGELGLATDQWSLSGQRHLFTEAQYAFPIMEGAGRFGFFGRIDVGEFDVDGSYDAAAGGARFDLSF